ncbi:MAG: O-succinylhomoserine sulfhydrylase [Nevskiaceae bacterium]|nr:MAG: O-succinylhomoserine sulfhydrylase [Nevskiaceae bacterium]TBR74686.1 MAG: O-succinylhomoserine sulfhydrylase [Nevskiaceae bacterium]
MQKNPLHPNPAEKGWGPATLAVRACEPRGEFREHSAPIYATSSFLFDNAEQMAEVFAGHEPGYVYSRFVNPTVRAFEDRLAAMEGGEACVATGSGMGAILSTCLALLKAGDHILASRTIFGSTIGLFDRILGKFGVETSFVDPTELDAWRAGLRSNTRLLFVETPSNPLLRIADITGLADIAHGAGALLMVDNCFLTPVLQQPIKLGADLVIHSATKYIDGQGRCVGGAVVGSNAVVGDEVFRFLRTAGVSLSPFNAWVFLKGLETLPLRMRAHCDSAAKLAAWLRSHPQVERVYYLGLPDDPQHALACKQQSGFGGLVSFDVKGGRDAAWHVINACRLLSVTSNLGDTRTTITHPASTTHARITEAARQAAGIGQGLLRVSVGLEDIDDVITDLQRGLGG